MLHPEERLLADIQEYTAEAIMHEPLQKEASKWQMAKSLWRSMAGGSARGALKATKPGMFSTFKNFLRPTSWGAPNKAITKSLAGASNPLNTIKGGFMPGHSGRVADKAARELLASAQKAGIDPSSRRRLGEYAKKTFGGAGQGDYNFVGKAHNMWQNPAQKAKFLRGQAYDLRNVAPEQITSSMAKSLKPIDLGRFQNKSVSQRTSNILGKKWNEGWNPSITKPILPTPTAKVAPTNMNPAAPGLPLPAYGPRTAAKPQAKTTSQPQAQAQQQAKPVAEPAPKLTPEQQFAQTYANRGGTWNDPNLQKQWAGLNPNSKAEFMKAIRTDATLGGAFGKMQTSGWGALNPIEKTKLIQTGMIGFVGQRIVLKDRAVL